VARPGALPLPAGIAHPADASENGLVTLQTYRTGTVSKEEDGNGGKSRAVRARQRAIGRELRRMYDGVVSEPVPDEFMDLLRRIDDAEADKKKPS
jgi:hypothetical protein